MRSYDAAQNPRFLGYAASDRKSIFNVARWSGEKERKERT
jgi:hypothetical protein